MANRSDIFSPAAALNFFRACPDYQPTPLIQRNTGRARLWLKDETNRMRIGAFKGLGGIYAVARLIAQETGGESSYESLSRVAAQTAAARLTFVCASAGNHGMAVATGAQMFGASARIHLPSSVPPGFVARLASRGADVVTSGSTYEESMDIAAEDARESGAILLADSSWSGYTKPARLVMEGYTVMAEEMREQFQAASEWPTHVFLQAGVGGLAAAVAHTIRKSWSIQPEIIVVEPEAAACLGRSIEADAIVTVDGPVSNMGRLDCKVPSILAFEVLRATADRFVTVTDAQAAEATAEASQLGLDTTPSGAAGLAAAKSIQSQTDNSLVVITEGPVAAD